METLCVSALDILTEETEFHITHCTAIIQMSMRLVSYQYQETRNLHSFTSQQKHNIRRAKGVCAVSP